LSTLLSRVRATHNVPFIVIEPAGNAPKLAMLLRQDPDMRLYKLSWDTIRINTVEWIAEALNLEEGLAEQMNHTKALLEVMLGHRLSNLQEGFLARALLDIYRGFTPEMLDDQAQAPRLEMLCEVLMSYAEERHGEEADILAAELDGKYVAGGYGRIFNAASNLPMGFAGADIFDAADVAGADTGNRDFQTILYYTLLAHAMRAARRDKRAGRLRRRVLALDEYYALSQNQYLRERLNVMIRILRNLYVSVWLTEQTITTMANAADNSLIANIPFWHIYHMEEAEAKLVPLVFGQRCPQVYANRLPTLLQGQCVAMLDNTFLMKNELLSLERDALL